MTDERYVYNQDQRERKRTASGSKARRCGAKSRRCTLPSDTLTPAQKAKLNGPVTTVDLKRPMRYTNLKKLPPSLQYLYLEHLVSVHKARRTDLLDMLGIVQSTFFNLSKALPGRLAFPRGRRKQAPEWVAFMAAGYADESSQPQEAAQPLEPDTPADAPPVAENATAALTAPPASILAGSITVRCTAPAMLDALLRTIGDPSQQFTFTVNFAI